MKEWRNLLIVLGALVTLGLVASVFFLVIQPQSSPGEPSPEEQEAVQEEPPVAAANICPGTQGVDYVVIGDDVFDARTSERIECVPAATGEEATTETEDPLAQLQAIAGEDEETPEAEPLSEGEDPLARLQELAEQAGPEIPVIGPLGVRRTPGWLARNGGLLWLGLVIVLAVAGALKRRVAP